MSETQTQRRWHHDKFGWPCCCPLGDGHDQEVENRYKLDIPNCADYLNVLEEAAEELEEMVNQYADKDGGEVGWRKRLHDPARAALDRLRELRDAATATHGDQSVTRS